MATLRHQREYHHRALRPRRHCRFHAPDEHATTNRASWPYTLPAVAISCLLCFVLPCSSDGDRAAPAEVRRLHSRCALACFPSLAGLTRLWAAACSRLHASGACAYKTRKITGGRAHQTSSGRNPRGFLGGNNRYSNAIDRAFGLPDAPPHTRDSHTRCPAVALSRTPPISPPSLSPAVALRAT